MPAADATRSAGDWPGCEILNPSITGPAANHRQRLWIWQYARGGCESGV